MMLSAAIWQVCVIRLAAVKPDRTGGRKMISTIAGAMILAIKLAMILQLRSRRA